jgi:hypothetical protein
VHFQGYIYMDDHLKHELNRRTWVSTRIIHQTWELTRRTWVYINNRHYYESWLGALGYKRGQLPQLWEVTWRTWVYMNNIHPYESLLGALGSRHGQGHESWLGALKYTHGQSPQIGELTWRIWVYTRTSAFIIRVDLEHLGTKTDNPSKNVSWLQ